MKNIKNYKDRFFSLLESEMGNVKPLIKEDTTTSAFQGISQYDIDATSEVLKRDFGLKKTNQEIGNDIIKTRYEKKMRGGKVLAIEITYDETSRKRTKVLLTPFLMNKGGSFQNITDEVLTKFGGKNEVSDPINLEIPVTIIKIIERIDEYGVGDDFDSESSEYSEKIKGLMEKNGLSQVKTDDGSMLFVKKINQGKSFLIKIKEEGSMVKIFPLVFDHEAHKNPIFYGKELPVRVGTINIERNQKDNPKVLSLDIDKEDISGSESKIAQAIEKGERLAKEYMSKFDAMKKLEDDPDFKLK